MQLYEVNGIPIVMERYTLSDYEKRILESILSNLSVERKEVLHCYPCGYRLADGSNHAAGIMLTDEQVRTLYAESGDFSRIEGMKKLAPVAEALSAFTLRQQELHHAEVEVIGIRLTTHIRMAVKRLVRRTWRTVGDDSLSMLMPLEQYLSIVDSMVKNEDYDIENLKIGQPELFNHIKSKGLDEHDCLLLTDAKMDAMRFKGILFEHDGDEVLGVERAEGIYYHIVASITKEWVELFEETINDGDIEYGDRVVITDVKKLCHVLGAYSANSLFKALEAILGVDTTVKTIKTDFLERLGIEHELIEQTDI